MKKALTQIIYGRDREIVDVLTQVKAWGYEGFELVLGPNGAVPVDAGPDDYKRLRDASDKTGVALVSICASGSGEGMLTDDDPAKRRLRRDEIVQAVEAAAALGIDGILVVPGRVTPDVPYDVAYDRVIEEMKLLAPAAEKAKVCLGIENVWNKLFTSPLDLRDAIDAVGSPCVGCFFDIGNFVFWSYPEQWIRILGKRICKVHFKDFKFENMHCEFSQLGDGQVDWARVMAALKEIGFDDYAISEVGGPDDLLAETSRRLDDILEM